MPLDSSWRDGEPAFAVVIGCGDAILPFTLSPQTTLLMVAGVCA